MKLKTHLSLPARLAIHRLTRLRVDVPRWQALNANLWPLRRKSHGLGRRTMRSVHYAAAAAASAADARAEAAGAVRCRRTVDDDVSSGQGKGTDGQDRLAEKITRSRR